MVYLWQPYSLLGAEHLGTFAYIHVPHLVLEPVPFQVQVSDAVAGCGGAHHGPHACRVRVPNAAAGARLRAWVWRHRTWEVVRLRREQEVPVPPLRRQRRRPARRLGQQRRHRPAADGGRVVMEADDRVVRVCLQYSSLASRRADGDLGEPCWASPRFRCRG